jgi:beta-glucoside PTS system EIICBA component
MEKKRNLLIDRAIDGVAGIFMPIVNLLSAAGILKGVLAILTAASVLSTESQTYLVLNAMADSLFYFLPIFLAFTSAKKFGTNPFTAVVIAGVVLYPSLTAIMEKGETVSFFGLPLRGVTYHSSVIPMILAVALLVFVERFFQKILPEMIKGILTPLFCILIVGTATLLVFGPLGALIGDGLAAVYESIYNLSPIIAGCLLGAFTQPMVIFGFHWSFNIIAMNNIAVNGHDTILAFMGPALFGQAGAALAVMLKSKNQKFRSVCASGFLSALFGVSEPALFGVNLPRKKPMIAACIGGAVGGIIAGISGAEAISFAFPSLVSLPVFYGKGFGLYLVSDLVAMAVGFLLTLLFKFPVDTEE